ncbi:MAG: cyclic nucleotide-binding domain-containing protein [Betaproteobacteria bacterium]|jgi:CRP/FNR family cyclic AMP-dependent transcriptional regulator|nr:cyclic nucleotide-binding domain-containing protein [Betaproteobacteria bacterium]MDH4294565.1 cyclic nucleotide-binding domain-containing protein [Betaproteobacteria bacterium]MDH5341935.1 cyclic nucleotide-binding domain-containing protein [Betaproteobacteria bacterium]
MEMLIAAWVAAGLVFASFFMKTIVPLRKVAIAGNIAFIVYALMGINFAIFDKVLPILVLHAALLILNIMRLREVQNTIRSVQAMTREHASLDALTPYMKRESIRRGELLFRKGALADRLYVLKKGRIKLVEFDKILEAGAVFGEVGIFSETEIRTSSAVSEDDSELYSLTSEKAVELFYQDPRFGFYIVRALARYVSEGADIASRQGDADQLLPGTSSEGVAVSTAK